MRLPLSQPSAWMAAASASSAKACSGLTAASLPDASEPSFQKLCRAVGGKWGVVSADTLFRLRRGMNEEDQLASLAFNQLFSAVDVPEVAELITSAASKHNSFGSLAAADKNSSQRDTSGCAGHQRTKWWPLCRRHGMLARHHLRPSIRVESAGHVLGMQCPSIRCFVPAASQTEGHGPRPARASGDIKRQQEDIDGRRASSSNSQPARASAGGEEGARAR